MNMDKLISSDKEVEVITGTQVHSYYNIFSCISFFVLFFGYTHGNPWVRD